MGEVRIVISLVFLFFAALDAQLTISLVSLGFSLFAAIIISLIGFIGVSQIRRIDKHDDLIINDYKKLHDDITEIKENVAKLTGRFLIRED